jgi:hypothetical protein
MTETTQYATRRRLTHKTTGKPLSGFAVDWTIRFAKDGSGYLDDHNWPDNPLVFNNLEELRGFVNEELDRHYAEHFNGE